MADTNSPSTKTHPVAGPIGDGAPAPAMISPLSSGSMFYASNGNSSPSLQKITSSDSTRRTSIQFVPTSDASKMGAPLGRVRTGSQGGRKMSPPPAPKFEHRVAFDTFDKKNEYGATSYTLARKHADYHFSRQSRTFLCGLDSNDYSTYALEWLIDELVDDGDEVVCLRVVDKDSSIAASSSVERGKYKEEADKLMEAIVTKNHENKAINLVLEFSIGKVGKVIMRMIKLYEPALLIVGTRGRNLGGIQGLLPGSVSKYCLQNSPIPVIVVRPNNMRARGKRKRQQDPSRQVYRDLLDKTDKLPQRADVLDRINVVLESGQAVSVDEAAAVAKAIGMGGQPNKPGPSRGSPGPPARGSRSPLIMVQSADDDEIPANVISEKLPPIEQPVSRPLAQRKASDPPSPNSPLASVQELPEVPEHEIARKPVTENNGSLSPPT